IRGRRRRRLRVRQFTLPCSGDNRPRAGLCGKDALMMAGSAKLTFDPGAFNARHGGVSIGKFGENRTIYAQGHPADTVFFIQKGRAKLTVLSEQGKERVVTILEAGDFCGEECLADQQHFAATATTMSECVIVRLEKASVVRALHEDTSFSEFFVSYLLVRN